MENHDTLDGMEEWEEENEGEEQEETVSPYMGQYLREIARTPMLSREEEREAIARFAGGDLEARDLLIRANLRFVVNVAKKFRGWGLSFEDLVAEGNIGLLKAMEQFDATYDVRINTYAGYWIDREIKCAIRDKAGTIRVPAYMIPIVTIWKRAANALSHELHRPATDREIARAAFLDEDKIPIVKLALHAMNPIAQETNASWEERAEGESDIQHLIADPSAGPEEQVMKADQKEQVMRTFATINKRRQRVIALHLGMGAKKAKTLEQIAKGFKITRERVRQVESDGFDEMRDKIQVLLTSHPAESRST